MCCDVVFCCSLFESCTIFLTGFFFAVKISFMHLFQSSIVALSILFSPFKRKKIIEKTNRFQGNIAYTLSLYMLKWRDSYVAKIEGTEDETKVKSKTIVYTIRANISPFAIRKVVFFPEICLLSLFACGLRWRINFVYKRDSFCFIQNQNRVVVDMNRMLNIVLKSEFECLHSSRFLLLVLFKRRAVFFVYLDGIGYRIQWWFRV